jgi:hypothetical protein
VPVPSLVLLIFVGVECASTPHFGIPVDLDSVGVGSTTPVALSPDLRPPAPAPSCILVVYERLNSTLKKCLVYNLYMTSRILSHILSYHRLQPPGTLSIDNNSILSYHRLQPPGTLSIDNNSMLNDCLQLITLQTTTS